VVVRLDYFTREDIHRIARHLCRQWVKQIYEKQWFGPMLDDLLAAHEVNGAWSVRLLESVDDVCRKFN